MNSTPSPVWQRFGLAISLLPRILSGCACSRKVQSRLMKFRAFSLYTGRHLMKTSTWSAHATRLNRSLLIPCRSRFLGTLTSRAASRSRARSVKLTVPDIARSGSPSRPTYHYAKIAATLLIRDRLDSHAMVTGEQPLPCSTLRLGSSPSIACLTTCESRKRKYLLLICRSGWLRVLPQEDDLTPL